MWTTPGSRKQQGLTQRRKQHLNICTGLKEPTLLKSSRYSLSLGKLKSLPENHQSHTVWFYTSAEPCQDTGIPFHPQVKKTRVYNKHRYCELYPLINISCRLQKQRTHPGSRYHPVFHTLVLSVREEKFSLLIMVVLWAESTNHFLRTSCNGETMIYESKQLLFLVFEHSKL